MTEREKMLSGELYDSSDEELAKRRELAHRLNAEYNLTHETQIVRRSEIIKELLPNATGKPYLQGPVFFDYGCNTFIGENFYANFNFTVLDCAEVKIGSNVMMGPNCSLVTPVHPLGYKERNFRFKSDGTPYTMEYAKPIIIGDNCWLASNVTVIGGVKIGNGCVIGAGSVVTRDIPDNSLAVGNPCRVIKSIAENCKEEIK